MNQIGHLIINGSSCTVVHADGTEEDVRALVTRATADIGGTMNQYSAGENGNIRLGFDASYFKRKDEITPQQRHELELRKLRATVAIANEFEVAGIPVGTWFNVSTSYYDKQKNVWTSTLQIWLNKENQAGRSTGTKTEESVEDLYERALIAGVDEAYLDETYEKFESKPGILKAKLRAMTIKVSANQTVEDAQVDDEDLPPQVAG